MKFVSVEIDFNALANEVAAIFQYRCKEKGLELSLKIGAMQFVYIDNLHIRQILFNLIGNSVKFTAKGGITIGADFIPTDDESGNLDFYVSDSGMGISKDERQLLFKPFVQSRNIRGTKTANMGVGLGLSIVSLIVGQMKGKISLESELGKGAKFTVSLYGVKYCAVSRKVAAEKSDNAAALRAAAGKMSVLLVDNIAMNLRALKALCLKVGLGEVATASGAREALEILQKRKFDAVLTDIWMPEMDGKDLLESIKADGRLSKTRVYAVTGDAEAKTDPELDKFTGILLKPITFETIKNIFHI